MVENIIEQGDCTAKDIATALAYLSQQSNPLPSYEIETAQAEPDTQRKTIL